MKGMSLSCKSQASTAISASLDRRSATVQNGPRHDHGHTRNSKFNYTAPCSASQLPINPTKLYEYYERNYKQSNEEVLQRKTSVDSGTTTNSVKLLGDWLRSKSCVKSVNSGNVFSLLGSNRYLLGQDKVPYIDWIDESYNDHVVALASNQQNSEPIMSNIKTKLNYHEYSHRRCSSFTVPSTPNVCNIKTKPNNAEHSHRRCSSFTVPSASSVCNIKTKPNLGDHGHRRSSSLTAVSSTPKPATTPTPLKSSCSTRTRDQVVVLRVSIHCKGCEGKVRKHISKMEGVTSFSIDLEAKKVTIMGDITPWGVLSSISKVKSAQLWQSPSSSPSPSSRWSN